MKIELDTYFSARAGDGNRAWDPFSKLWIKWYDRTVDLHFRPRGLPSHVTLGLCPYIPSFYLSRGGGRFLLPYWVVALMEISPSASPVLLLSWLYTCE
jgi:hypothetical protein